MMISGRGIALSRTAAEDRAQVQGMAMGIGDAEARVLLLVCRVGYRGLGF